MVEVITKFDESAQKAMSRLTIRRLLLVYVFLALLIILIGIIILLDDFVIGIIIIIGGAVGVPFGVLLGMIIRQSNAKKKILLHGDITSCFTFDGNFLYSKTTSFSGVNEINSLPSNILVQAIETKEHFFVYVNKVNAYVLPKKDIVQGTAEELRNILHTWFGPKFKIKGRF